MGGENRPRELPQSSIRKVVEREFAKSSPQLQGVSEVVFEAEGIDGPSREQGQRVWLICPFGRNFLLGYDGEQWIERRLKKGLTWQADAMHRAFVQFDGGVALFERGGCHVLTGANWIFHDLVDL